MGEKPTRGKVLDEVVHARNLSPVGLYRGLMKLTVGSKSVDELKIKWIIRFVLQESTKVQQFGQLSKLGKGKPHSTL